VCVCVCVHVRVRACVICDMRAYVIRARAGNAIVTLVIRVEKE